MKTILDKTTRDELISRINTINNNSTSQWGKMNVYQMLKHCTLWQEMITGQKKYKQTFIGRVFGKMLLNNAIKDDSPMKRSTPTLPEFKNLDKDGDIDAQKKKWITLIDNHSLYTKSDFVHPFFGKMTKEQIGYHAYKHIDHHLRQFNS
jgi:hypothetical protein